MGHISSNVIDLWLKKIDSRHDQDRVKWLSSKGLSPQRSRTLSYKFLKIVKNPKNLEGLVNLINQR